MENNPPQGRGLRPLISLQRHGRKGLVLAFLLLMLGIPVVWIKGQSYFVAESVFQVWPNYQKTLSADKDLELQSNSQYREFVNHLSRSVLRYDVLEGALVRLKAAGVNPRLPSEDDRKCIERLQRTLYVYALADTYMVRVGLQSDNPDTVDKIVNAVMESFLETTRNEQIYGSDDRTRVLLDRSTALRAEVATLDQQRAQLAGRLGLTTFGENTANPYDAMLAQAREKLSLATIERSQAQATLDAFNAQGETPASAGRSVLEMRLQDNGLQALRNEVVKRSEELNRTLAGLEDKHPARQPAAAEQGEINARLQARETAFQTAAQQNIRSRLMASVMQTRQVEKDLRDRVQALEAQATGYATNFRDAMRMTGEIRKREQELDEMRNRLNYVNTERNAIGFVRLISKALPPTTPQGTGKTRLLLILLAAAAALGLASPVAFDLLDRRILVVGDAERALGIASAAWFVQVDDEATRVLAHDQFRRFASTLLRNQSRGARGVFGFTSVKVGGGATAVVLEVARTLVELGSRVLVVDANSLALASALASDRPGLTELLAGRATAAEIIQQQSMSGTTLPVVGFGHARDTGIQRLDILRDALASWAQEFDTVLVDIAPILPSADAELVIDAIGQVFLVVEAGVANKGEVARARAQLERLAPEAVGLVVNKVPLENGGPALRAQMVETITRGRFQTFMSTPYLRLQYELLKTRIHQWRTRSRR